MRDFSTEPLKTNHQKAAEVAELRFSLEEWMIIGAALTIALGHPRLKRISTTDCRPTPSRAPVLKARDAIRQLLVSRDFIASQEMKELAEHTEREDERISAAVMEARSKAFVTRTTFNGS